MLLLLSCQAVQTAGEHFAEAWVMPVRSLSHLVIALSSLYWSLVLCLGGSLGFCACFLSCKLISAELEAWILINNFGTISVAEISAPYAAGTNTGNGLFGVGVIPPFDIILHGSPNSCSTESRRPGLVPSHHTHTLSARFYFLFFE